MLAERELDALLVTDLVNVRYLTGFTGSSGLAVVGRDLRRFVTDFRYVEQAAEQVDGFDREQAPQEFLNALADGWPGGELRLGFEDEEVSVRRHMRLRDVLPDRVELVPAGGIVEGLRAVKDAGEVERIGAAAALVDEVYGVVREQGLVGRTEREVALAIEDEMRRRGASAPSFPSIVASAERGALPHAVPDRRADPRGDARHARRRRACSTATARTARARGRPVSCPTTSPPRTTSSGARRRPRWPRSGRAPRAGRSTPSRAT